MKVLWSRFARQLRRLSGEDAYQRYLEHFASAHASASSDPPLSRREFERRRTEQRWSGISRCC